MTSYQSPGVYVEEVPSQQRPIAGVGTSTAVFIGYDVPQSIQLPVRNDDYDPQGIEVARARTAELEAEVKKLTEKRDALPPAQGDDKKSPRRVAEEALKAKKDELADHKQSIQSHTAIKAFHLEEFTLKAKPLAVVPCTNFSEYARLFGGFSADEPTYVGHRNLTHAVYGFFENGGTRCYVVHIGAGDIEKVLEKLEPIDEIALVAAPGVTDEGIVGKIQAHCDKMGDRFAILDAPEDLGESPTTQLQVETGSKLPSRNKNCAFYLPWLKIIDPAKKVQDLDVSRSQSFALRAGRAYVPPSGHVAGLYARVDATRGVHKAPANEALLGPVGLRYYLTKDHQQALNPQGANLIRDLNGQLTVYGARTLGGDLNSEWKYVNVRRLFLFLRESIDEGTQWAVFEPNDQRLWGKISRNVTAFLMRVWRTGGLVGATPQEAFYVKCDRETNPADVVGAGQVVTEIGVAIVRPAEFVIFRVSQWAGNS